MKYEGNNFNKKQKTIKIYLCIHTYILLSVQYAYVKKFKKEIMYVATYIIHTYVQLIPVARWSTRSQVSPREDK